MRVTGEIRSTTALQTGPPKHVVVLTSAAKRCVIEPGIKEHQESMGSCDRYIRYLPDSKEKWMGASIYQNDVQQ